MTTPTSPTPTRVEQTKRDLDRLIHPMLVGGVVLSSILMLAGLGLALARGQVVPDAVPPLDQVLPLALAGQPAGILALGLLVLIATPILRVAGSVLAFIYERDWRYALITFIVFMIVVASLLLGRG